MRTRYTVWVGVLFFSLVSGFAQKTGPAEMPESPECVPPGSANHLVTLDVVVTDKSGRPLHSLQAQDFTLLDNKQPQKIVSFRAVEGGTATADPPVQVILLLDEVNTSFSLVAIVRGGIKEFLLRNHGELARPVSLALLSDSGITFGNKVSQDGNAVMADLQEGKYGLRTVGSSQGVFGAEDRVRMSLQGLQRLAAHEAPKPGRKLVVWIGPGWALFRLQPLGLTSEQQQRLFNSVVAVSDALRRARITLYAVDPLGGELRPEGYKEFLKPVTKPRQVHFGNLALQVLTDQSGGLVINSHNDVADEIAASVADANAFYVLSCEALAGTSLDEFHTLEIKVDKPGAKARTRAGYYAQPERHPQ